MHNSLNNTYLENNTYWIVHIPPKMHIIISIIVLERHSILECLWDRIIINSLYTLLLTIQQLTRSNKFNRHCPEKPLETGNSLAFTDCSVAIHIQQYFKSINRSSFGHIPSKLRNKVSKTHVLLLNSHSYLWTLKLKSEP